MNQHIAFIGTGECDQGEIGFYKALQWSLLFLILFFTLFIWQRIILNKTKNTKFRVIAFILWLLAFFIFSGIIIASGFDAMCSNYDGFF